MHWFLCKKDTDIYYPKKQPFTTNSTDTSHGRVKPQVAVALIDAGWGDATPWSKGYLRFVAGKSRGGWKSLEAVRMLLFFFRRACAASAHGCLGAAWLSQRCTHGRLKYSCKECRGSKVPFAGPVAVLETAGPYKVPAPPPPRSERAGLCCRRVCADV